MRLRTMLPLVAAAVLAAPAAAQADFMHTVMPGESLTSIAATDGLTIGQLAAANGISPFTKLVAGSTLAIPPRGAPTSTSAPTTRSTGAATGSTHVCDGDNDADDTGCATATRASTTTASVGGSYLVRPGDTLSGIAARAGTTVANLAALNGLNPRAFLLYGTVLRLPGARAISPGSVASTQPVGAAAVGSRKAAPYPTAQRVTAGQIGSIAQANGVPPALAQAIAWQESGFNNNAVSRVGARGVMQILPGTWNWIGQSLTPGMALSPSSALDNVRGGVLMLHALLGATGGNQAEAAAGYYQGLSSVQQRGMYPSTHQYVNDVLALEHRFGGG